MGSLGWTIVATPYLVVPAAVELGSAPSPIAPTNEDVFAGDVMLSEGQMKDAAGGTDYAIDIDDLGVNFSNSEATVAFVNASNSETGQIANNTVSANSGITTVLNNTGNGVVFQTSVQVNIFLNDPVAGQ